MALFRTFAALNTQNLLYLQAEITRLEKQLRKCEIEDSNSQNEERAQYALDWYWLDDSQDEDTDKTPEEFETAARQYEIFKKIRAKLNEYNHALIQARILAQIPPPDTSDVSALQHTLLKDGKGKLKLSGDDAYTWGQLSKPKSQALDLVALRPRQNEDPFSMWVAGHGISLLELLGSSIWKKKSRIHGEVSLEDCTVFRITSWVTSILASIVPIGSILALYTVSSMNARLGIIAGFNILISICVSTFTNAKRAEIFTIAAAFAAVQVVFVGVDKDTTDLYKLCNPNFANPGNASILTKR